MTPTQLEEFARQRYNAVSDTFWSQAEILNYMYMACSEMASRCGVIERTFSTTTVSGTQAYDFPTNAKEIKRVTWDGKKLTPIDMREDDAATGMNMATTDTGNPEYYWQWNNAIYLRPVPGSAATLKVWSRNFPSSIAIGSTLEIPEEFHLRLANFINQQMAAKDQNFDAAQYWGSIWAQDLVHAEREMRKKKRADGFASVKDENLVIETYIT